MIRKRSGQTDGQTDGHVRHTIIRPVIDGRIKSRKYQILCHEIEPNPSKDRSMHEGDNPSFLNEFMKFTLYLIVVFIFVFLSKYRSI